MCRPGKGGGATGAFSMDRRYLAHSALVCLLLYWAFSRCTALAGRWPCGDAAECAVTIEWTAIAIGAAQAMACVVTAAGHRLSRTAGLLNGVCDVLARHRRSAAGWPRSHVLTAGTYAAVALATAVARFAAAAVARPDRFRVADVLLVCVPVAAVPVAVECAAVCVCSAAENACRDVVARLCRLARVRGGTRRLPPVRWQQVETAWRDYWRCCRLVDGLSRCYGLDLAVNLAVNTLLFVVYAYVTLVSVHASLAGHDDVSAAAAASLYWNAALVCQLACVSFRIVFISYRAEMIKRVSARQYTLGRELALRLPPLNVDIETFRLSPNRFRCCCFFFFGNTVYNFQYVFRQIVSSVLMPNGQRIL